MKKKDIERVEMEKELDKEATLNANLAVKMQMISKEREKTDEKIEEMTWLMTQSNATINSMNLYIWEVIKETRKQGYNIPPPSWNLGKERDN